ncbi:uncharacterized protein B0H18DRAFT_1082238 [Fomitopsis serialis]|uniref:uncharacterized protein n=1 Tax=Fomitopsis serialis TaxID=139415 RepID=UPI00200721D8|nr:uncharacterized protein B0H18DRAFT_1082238 [Neoantrodia serialis]KAH9935467.1 hypothetical protein B0H18DRAFT_1082238 [Neoantrodia serialis]
MSASPPPTTQTTGTSTSRHALNAVDKQRAQLERLLKDPSKPAYVPPPPKEKSIRPAREMMKNVQGSSAGAGSGEFHVYKASRRREYERLKMMDETAEKEAETLEFERKQREREEQAEAKTAKNRTKRQKKKERAKGKGAEKDSGVGAGGSADRRLISGKELIFRRPGEESDEDEDVGPVPAQSIADAEDDLTADATRAPVIDAPRITIHEEDSL